MHIEGAPFAGSFHGVFWWANTVGVVGQRKKLGLSASPLMVGWLVSSVKWTEVERESGAAAFSASTCEATDLVHDGAHPRVAWLNCRDFLGDHSTVANQRFDFLLLPIHSSGWNTT